jgi:pantothenate synthetase
MNLVADAFRNGVEKISAETLGKEYLSENDLHDLDYLEIRSENLLDAPSATDARVFIALNIDGVRLIDNLKISK